MSVIGLVKTLARELAKDHILVNAVCPGYIATNRMLELIEGRAQRTGKRVEEAREAVENEAALGRLGTTDEVAALLAFSAAGRGSVLTGAVRQGDGGLYRRG